MHFHFTSFSSVKERHDPARKTGDETFAFASKRNGCARPQSHDRAIPKHQSAAAILFSRYGPVAPNGLPRNISDPGKRRNRAIVDPDIQNTLERNHSGHGITGHFGGLGA